MKLSANYRSLLPFLLFVFIIIGYSSCDPKSPNLNANDLNIEAAENPDLNQVIGQINASSDEDLDFQLVSVDPAGAITVDDATGDIRVADPDLFDFEELDLITAIVNVTSGIESKEIEVRVNITDISAPMDDINNLIGEWRTSKFSWAGIFASSDNHTCRLDDMLTLANDGQYTYNGGNELCGNEDNQQLKTGTWVLDENLGFILFDKDTNKAFKATIDFYQPEMLSLSGSYMGILVSGEFVPN